MTIQGGDGPPGARAAPSGALRRRTGGALALAAAASAGWTALLAGRGWFYYDDFWNLTVAHGLGWGWDLLGRPVFGHVTPGAGAVVGLVAGPGGFSYGWAVATLAVPAALVPPLAAAAARSLGSRPWPAVAAGVAAAAAAPVAAGSTWWSAGLNLYPSMLGGMGLLAGVGAARRGRWWGAPVAGLALAAAMACSDGAAVFLVVPVVLALGRPGPVRARLAGAFGRPSGWAWAVAPLVLAAAVRASASGPVETYARAPLGDLVSFPVVFLVKGFVPALAGMAVGRVELLGSPSATVVAGVVGLALGSWALRDRLRPGFGVAVAAIALTVLARGALVAWGRLALLGWDDAVEVRYVADLAWLVPVVVAGWWRPPRHARSGPVARAPLAAFVVLGLVGQAVLAHGSPARDSAAYRHRLASSWRAQPPGTAVVDALVPAEVLGPQFGEFLFLSRTVARGGLTLRFEPGRRVVAPDASGRLQAVRLEAMALLEPDAAFTAVGEPPVAHRGGCWVAGARPALVWVPLTRPVRSAAWVLDLRLSARSSPAVSFVAAGVEPARGIAASPEGRGARRWIVATVPFAASQVGFALPARARLCLASGAVTVAEAVR